MITIIALMYLSDIISAIGVISLISLIILSIVAVTFIVNYSDTSSTEKEERERLLKYIKKIFKVICICFALLIFIPSNKTINSLIASIAVKELSNVESINQLGGKAVKVIDSYLDGIIKENIDKLKEESK